MDKIRGEVTWYPPSRANAATMALTDIAGFNGIVGVISCDEFGDCGTGRVQISHRTASNVTDDAQLPVVYRFAP